MIDVVIIGKDEGKYVNDMIKSLPKHWKKIYVADRCTDNTIQTLKELEEEYNVYIFDTTPLQKEGRQTSYCRNIGLYLTNLDNDVLFLDGDRVITNPEVLEFELNQAKSEIVLLTLEKGDYRGFEEYDFSQFYGNVLNDFFSAGIFIKRSAINKIVSHPILFQPDNNVYSQLFPEELQSVWGIEDTGLGDICYDLGISADVNKVIKLRGSFERRSMDSLDVVEQRLKFRDKLSNVLW